jgi:hypothetical protein
LHQQPLQIVQIRKKDLQPVYWNFVPAGLFILNFILKILYVSYTEIGLDEPYTLFYSQKNFAGIFEVLNTSNNAPLHFVFMHYWMELFGISPFSVRLPSVLFSALSAPLIYFIGKKHFDHKAGLIAALLFSASSCHIYFAHDARVETIFFFLCGCSYLCYLNLINSYENRILSYIIRLTVINILLCYAHFFGFLIIFLQLFLALIFRQYHRYLIPLLKSIACVLISYLIYYEVLFRQFMESSGGTWVKKPLLSDLYTMLWRFSNQPVIAVILIFVFGIGVSILLKKIKITFSNAQVIFLSFFFLYGGLFVLSFIVPVFADRYLLFTSLFLYLSVGIIFGYLIKINYRLSFLSLIPVVLMFATIDLKKGKKTSYRQVVAYLKPRIDTPVNIILTKEFEDLNFTYHYNPLWFNGKISHVRDSLIPNRIYPATIPAQLSKMDFNLPAVLISHEKNELLPYLLTYYDVQEIKKFPYNYQLTFLKVKAVISN